MARIKVTGVLLLAFLSTIEGAFDEQVNLQEQTLAVGAKDDDDSAAPATSTACKVSKWGLWTQAKGCGHVQIQRTRKVIQSGPNCPALTQKKEICQKCACKVSAWSKWETQQKDSKLCGDQTFTRHRTFTRRYVAPLLICAPLFMQVSKSACAGQHVG
jgi:hypothetical protein